MTRNNKTNEQLASNFEKYIPIFDTLLVIAKKKFEKLLLPLNKKNKNIVNIRKPNK